MKSKVTSQAKSTRSKSTKCYWADYSGLDYLDLIMLEDILRRVVKNRLCYAKIILWKDMTKKLADYPSIEFSELFRILNTKKNNFNMLFINNPETSNKAGYLYHVIIYRKSDDTCIVSVDFYDFGMMLCMNAETKKKLESKYGLDIITKEQHLKNIGYYEQTSRKKHL